LKLDPIEIRLATVPGAPALARTFVTELMTHSGVDPDQMENVKIVISDITTALLAEQQPVRLLAEMADDAITFRGTCPTEVPATSALLAGEVMTVEGDEWAIRLPVT
jgi:hypothetical protein